jgi:hypothetical protein
MLLNVDLVSIDVVEKYIASILRVKIINGKVYFEQTGRSVDITLKEHNGTADRNIWTSRP